MSLYPLLRFLHISAAIVFVGGLFARQAVRSLSSRASSIESVVALSEAAGVVERLMVIPGNALVIVFGLLLALFTHVPILGSLQGDGRNWLFVSIVILVLLSLQVPLVFLPRGKRFGAALQEALSKGEITSELVRQMEDPIVRAAHLAEMTAVVLVMVLMVFKPF